MRQALMHAEPSPEDLDEQEMTFLEDVYQLMQAAHFRLLSAEDWNTAQAEQFTVRHGEGLPLLCAVQMPDADAS